MGADNGFEGGLDGDGISKLVDLEILYVDGNNMSGSIPWNEIGQGCKKLKELLLHDNGFEGGLDGDGISKLVDLEYLSVYGNKMSGSIPWNEIGQGCKKLKELYLGKSLKGLESRAAR